MAVYLSTERYPRPSGLAKQRQVGKGENSHCPGESFAALRPSPTPRALKIEVEDEKCHRQGDQSRIFRGSRQPCADPKQRATGSPG
jgi:hypothetical protein